MKYVFSWSRNRRWTFVSENMFGVIHSSCDMCGIFVELNPPRRWPAYEFESWVHLSQNSQLTKRTSINWSGFAKELSFNKKANNNMLMQIMCCLHKLRSITGKKGTSLGTLGISQFVPIYFILKEIGLLR